MVARVLVVNDDKLDIAPVVSKLQDLYYSLLFARSVENALRIVGTQFIDAVLLSIPERVSEGSPKLLLDFFALLRQLCGVIPIIGLAESPNQQIPPIVLDDVLHIGMDSLSLAGRIETLVRLKNLFDDSLLSNMFLEKHNAQKIVTIFYNNINFLPKSILENTEVTMLMSWPVIDNISDADIFIINMSHTQAHECCANLRLRKINHHKPIVFTFDQFCQEKIDLAREQAVGFTDIIDVNDNPFVIGCRLNSLIKYKKLQEAFCKKLKKSLHLSTVDSTTEVYNRSFFDDYLKNMECKAEGFAVILLDVDKFKTINDRFGHSFADSMLRYVAGMIKRHTRSLDMVARYGGDEFIVLMGNVTKHVAKNIANRIQKKIGESLYYDARCTMSIGVCCVDPGGKISLQEAISIADKFMYVAKESGGNAVHVCS
ncbi:MAG: diguanylate cyclase [Holosporaceae bacterium]|jgi:two-component system cell cycle response regulator|nr:diguanylate cyclase [Holosporaceae bacterium]